MGDIFFVIRILILTVVVSILMQIKIGETTLETKAQEWTRESTAVTALREVAGGAVRVMSRAYRAVVSVIDARVSNGFDRSQMPGQRQLSLGLKRSESYMREEEEKRRTAEAMAEEAPLEESPAKR